MILDLTIRVTCGEPPSPDTIFIFADPLWSGVWSEVHSKKDGSFRVNAAINPLPTSSLDPSQRHPVMCNLLKLYFYTRYAHAPPRPRYSPTLTREKEADAVRVQVRGDHLDGGARGRTRERWGHPPRLAQHVRRLRRGRQVHPPHDLPRGAE